MNSLAPHPCSTQRLNLCCFGPNALTAHTYGSKPPLGKVNTSAPQQTDPGQICGTLHSNLQRLWPTWTASTVVSLRENSSSNLFICAFLLLIYLIIYLFGAEPVIPEWDSLISVLCFLYFQFVFKGNPITHTHSQVQADWGKQTSHLHLNM